MAEEIDLDDDKRKNLISSENEAETDGRHPDVDGGYAWVILFASFTLFGIVNGFRDVIAVLYTEILDRYQAGQFLTSWLVTVQFVTYGFLGNPSLAITANSNLRHSFKFDCFQEASLV